MNSDNKKGLWELPPVRAYLDRIGATPKSLKTAYIEEAAGAYMRAKTKITFTAAGEVTAPESVAPTEAEAEAIKAACSGVVLPEQSVNKSLSKPACISDVPDCDAYRFETTDGEVIAWQVRKVLPDRGRAFFWWTYYTDGVWRMSEPEGGLPLYGLEQLKHFDTVVLHEGAKSARAMQNIGADHPWYEELRDCAHIGWAGGATNPHRTDWKPLVLSGVKKVIIVPDNDDVGRSAVTYICKETGLLTYMLRFTDEFPEGFDLADPFPAKMFSDTKTRIERDGGVIETRQYVGPRYHNLLMFNTWMTRVVGMHPNGRPIYGLNPAARGAVMYLKKSDRYIFRDELSLRASAEATSRILGCLSDGDIARIIRDEANKNFSGLCYRPEHAGEFIVETERGVCLNTYEPPRLRARRGDVGPFLRFMEHVFPLVEEREFVKKWLATLVACPGVRMQMALLLMSITQGTGKGTLAYVVTRLVGHNNSSEVTPQQIIESQFNDWRMDKRFIVVHEIYEGHDFKAYQKLKSCITEKEFLVNSKNEKTYMTDSYVNLLLCSNNPQALRIEDTDRRFYLPTITEVRWPPDEAKAFYHWFNGGGDAIVLDWAKEWGDYLEENVQVPMTARKLEVTQSSMPDGDAWAQDMARAVAGWGEEKAVSTTLLYDHVKKTYPRDYPKELKLKSIVSLEGMFPLDARFKINGRRVRVQVNALMKEAMEKTFGVVYSPLKAWFLTDKGHPLGTEGEVAAYVRSRVATIEMIEDHSRRDEKSEGIVDEKVLPFTRPNPALKDDNTF